MLYTDKPATLPAERLNIQSQKTDTVAVQTRAEEDAKRLQDADKANQQAAGQNKDQQQATQLSATQKAEQCTKARQRYDTYMNFAAPVPAERRTASAHISATTSSTPHALPPRRRWT